jgi:hypothetical protein
VSHPFENDRDALADADAHRRQRVASTGRVQSIHAGRGQAGAAGAERMTEGDRTALRVDALVVVAQPEFAQDGKSLGSEGLIQFDDVDLFESKAG